MFPAGQTLYDTSGKLGKDAPLALIRVLMVALVFQTVVFASLWFYARARRRERMTEEWVQSGKSQSLDTYLSAGERAYKALLLRKLVISVYLVPTGLLALLIYLTSSG